MIAAKVENQGTVEFLIIGDGEDPSKRFPSNPTLADSIRAVREMGGRSGSYSAGKSHTVGDFKEVKFGNFPDFIGAYFYQYDIARTANPHMYRGDPDTVKARMAWAILTKTFSKDSYSFRATCKQLGIKHTYKAIDAFIRGE